MRVMPELRRLQELIDEAKENMRESDYINLSAAMTALYRATPAARSARRFWSATIVEVTPLSARRVSNQTTVCILEEVFRGAPPSAEGWVDVLRTAQISADTARDTMLPLIVRDGRGGLLIVVSVEELVEDDEFEDVSEV